VNKRSGIAPDPAALQPNIGAILHDVALIRLRFERRARRERLPRRSLSEEENSYPCSHRRSRKMGLRTGDHILGSGPSSEMMRRIHASRSVTPRAADRVFPQSREP